MGAGGILADLHLHTTASDGLLKPSELVELAVRQKLTAIAITDHDTVDGLDEAVNAASDSSLRVIAGAEWTATWKGHAHHFLSFGFDHKSDSIQQLNSDQRERRLHRATQLVEQLHSQFNIDLDREILSKDGVVCRSHLGAALIELLPKSRHDLIWSKYLSGGDGDEDWPEFSEVCDVVHGAGGVMILAHPGQRWSRGEILKLQDQGLDGVEALHPSHSPSTCRDLSALGFSRGMIVTGGSDWHGDRAHAHGLGSYGLTKNLWRRLEKGLEKHFEKRLDA